MDPLTARPRLALSEPTVLTVTWHELPRRAVLGECSSCHAVVPQGRYQEHVAWHSTLLHAPGTSPAKPT